MMTDFQSSPCRSEVHVSHDTDVPAPHRRNPVPSDRRVIRRVVGSKSAAVLLQSPESSVAAAGRGILLNANRDRILLTCT